MLILIWYLDLPKWTSKLLHTRFHLSSLIRDVFLEPGFFSIVESKSCWQGEGSHYSREKFLTGESTRCPIQNENTGCAPADAFQICCSSVVFVSFFWLMCYIIKSESANVFRSADASKLLNLCILFFSWCHVLCYLNAMVVGWFELHSFPSVEWNQAYFGFCCCLLLSTVGYSD